MNKQNLNTQHLRLNNPLFIQSVFIPTMQKVTQNKNLFLGLELVK